LLILVCLFLLLGPSIRSEPPVSGKASRTDRQGDPLPLDAIARLGTVRLRHPDGAMSLAFSPDGKLLASGGRDCIVRLWDSASGKEIHQLKGHGTWVQALAFSPDGKILASGTSHNDRLLLLWDTASGKKIRSLPGQLNGTTGLAFAPDGKSLASSGEDGAILVRETASGKELLKIQAHPDRAMTVAYSPDGRLLASGGARDPQSVVRLWDAATGKEVRQLRGHEQGICGVTFSPDGKTLASASFDATVRLWEVGTGKEVRHLKLDGIGRTVAFAPDGKILAAKSWDGPIRLWNAANGEELRQLPDSSGGSSVAFAPDSKTLAGGGLAIHLWDVATGKLRSPAPGSSGHIDSVGFAIDGKTVLSAESSGSVRWWDASTGKERACVEGLQRIYTKMAFAPRKAGRTVARADVAAGKALLWVQPGGSPYVAGIASDRQTLAARIKDETVPVYDAGTGAELRRLSPVVRAEKMLLSPDGKLLAVKEVGFTLRLLDAANGTELRRLQVAAGPDFAMAFAPDSKTLAANGIGTLDLWDVATGKPVSKLKPPRGASPFMGRIVFAPGGRAIAAWSGEGFALWDVSSGKVLGELISRTESVRVAVFAPDGRTLALGLADRTLRLWDAFTGQEIRRYRGHQALVGTVAFAPEGRALVSGGWDGTILMWDVTGGIAAKDRDAKDMPALWDDLAATDAVRADRAFWTLAAVRKRAIPMLRERLLPGPPREKPQLNRLIADLDNDAFAVREKAERALQKLGEQAEPALRLALEKKPSAEAQRRIENLLAKLKARSPEVGGLPVRQLRAVRVLEQIGTEEARDLLGELIAKTKEPALAVEARAALDRLARRKGPEESR
jgi:WD40 repeat protein